VPRRRAEPRWLSRTVADAIHQDQVREHGGLPGLRDETALESTLARARHKWLYDTAADIATLAAAYAFGFARNHPYRDGNKRIAFLSMATFLGMNGYELDATDADVVTEFIALAAGAVSEERVADWIRSHSTKRR
jgi:death-on-curing protein